MKKAYAIVIRNGLILLVRRQGVPVWDLPGGELLSNENEREGIQLLIKEQLSFDSTIDDLIGIYTKEYHDEVTYVYKVKEKEANQGHYITTYNGKKESVEAVLKDDDSVEVVNNKEFVPDTGITDTSSCNMSAGIIISLIALGVPLFISYFRWRRGFKK